MPLISVQYASQRSDAALKSTIAAEVSSLSAATLRKDPAVTAVIVEDIDSADWFVGSRSLAEQGMASVWIDIRITDGTNTKDEKADFIARAFARMGEILGPLHHESYIHVDDVRGDAYGFGGLTQERRYIAGKPIAAAEKR